jgi:hypothetical protein
MLQATKIIESLPTASISTSSAGDTRLDIRV